MLARSTRLSAQSTEGRGGRVGGKKTAGSGWVPWDAVERARARERVREGGREGYWAKDYGGRNEEMREGREGKVEKQVRKASPRRPCIDPSITSVPRDLIRLLHATQGV